MNTKTKNLVVSFLCGLLFGLIGYFAYNLLIGFLIGFLVIFFSWWVGSLENKELERRKNENY